MPASVQDPDNQEEQMDTSWKANNCNSTPKRLNQERNDVLFKFISKIISKNLNSSKSIHPKNV